MAGADVPVIVSEDDIREGLAEHGFAEVQIIDRDKFPIANLPRVPGASDDWDTVIIGRRVAPDGSVDVPEQVRWAVDVTPPLVIAGPTPTTPVLPGASVPPSTELPAGIPSWVLPQEQPPQGPPLEIPRVPQFPLLVGLGVIGGAAIGWWGVQHLFVEGITSKERKNILIAAATMLAVWGASELIGLEKAWWLTVEGVAEHTKSELEK